MLPFFSRHRYNPCPILLSDCVESIICRLLGGDAWAPPRLVPPGNGASVLCHVERVLHPNWTRSMAMTLWGVWTGCGKRQCTPSRQQVARNETEEPLIPLSFPTCSLLFKPAYRWSQRCMQLLSVALTLYGLDWTGLDWALPRLCAPQGLEGSTPWLTCYKDARSKQGITASSSLTCSNTSIAELTTGSNTPPTDSTDLRLTMQHKSGTA